MKRLTPGQLEFINGRHEILLKGEPSLEIDGKRNPAWIQWYRALHRVTSNIAKVHHTKCLNKRNMEKEA